MRRILAGFLKKPAVSKIYTLAHFARGYLLGAGLSRCPRHRSSSVLIEVRRASTRFYERQQWVAHYSGHDRQL